METWGVFLWLKSVLERNIHYLPDGALWLECAQCLDSIVRTWKSEPSVMSPSGVQNCMAKFVRFVTLCKSTPLLARTLVPKTHLMIHLLQRSRYHGNPLEYAVFLDEALNRKLKLALRNCHQCSFDRTALIKMREVSKRVSSATRKLDDVD